jgi:hypothetical protein
MVTHALVVGLGAQDVNFSGHPGCASNILPQRGRSETGQLIQKRSQRGPSESGSASREGRNGPAGSQVRRCRLWIAVEVHRGHRSIDVPANLPFNAAVSKNRESGRALRGGSLPSRRGTNA